MDAEHEAESQEDEGLNYAADDVMAAIEAKDPQMFKDALCSFIELYKK
jgi:hypothetical protein